MVRRIGQLAFLGGRVAAALLRRPRLIGTALRQANAMVPRRWWASSPRLPVPRPDYLAFRQVTLSGDANQSPEVDDVLVWLEWCKSMRSLPRRV